MTLMAVIGFSLPLLCPLHALAPIGIALLAAGSISKVPRSGKPFVMNHRDEVPRLANYRGSRGRTSHGVRYIRRECSSGWFSR